MRLAARTLCRNARQCFDEQEECRELKLNMAELSNSVIAHLGQNAPNYETRPG